MVFRNNIYAVNGTNDGVSISLDAVVEVAGEENDSTVVVVIDPSSIWCRA